MSRVVRPRATLPVALALAVTLLAGCGAPEEAPEPAQEPMEFGELEATATTGVIRGVVVDDAVRPVAGALVVARGPDGERNATTGDDGLFGFDRLAAGTWFVSVSKLAHETVQVTAEVVPGVSEPPVTKVLLAFVPSEAPFLVEVHVEAFVQCIVPGANVCAIINLYPCALAGYCQQIVDDTSFVVLHDPLVAQQRVPDWMQAELVWESTQAVTPGLAIQYSNYDPENHGRGTSSLAVRGRSPLLYTMEEAVLAEWEVGLTRGLGHEIFGHMDQTSAIGSVGFVLNQRVDFFFHAFYGHTPPDGWRFSVDGTAPPPR